MCTIPIRAFTAGGGRLVAEHSCLAAAGHVHRTGLPHHFYVRGDRCTIMYERWQEGTVRGPERETVAWVYRPVRPYVVGNPPYVHVLND